MSEFNLSKLRPEGSVEFILDVIPGVLIVEQAGEVNKGYFNALLRRNRTAGRRLKKGGMDAETIEKNRGEDRDLYPKYIIKALRGVLDKDGKVAEDTAENRKKFIEALPNWLFDELRVFASDPINFLPEGQEPALEPEEVEELGES